jgi:hypothetical protein
MAIIDLWLGFGDDGSSKRLIVVSIGRLQRTVTVTTWMKQKGVNEHAGLQDSRVQGVDAVDAWMRGGQVDIRLSRFTNASMTPTFQGCNGVPSFEV